MGTLLCFQREVEAKVGVVVGSDTNDGDLPPCPKGASDSNNSPLPPEPSQHPTQLGFLEKAILGSAQQVPSVELESALMSASQSVLVRRRACLHPWLDRCPLGLLRAGFVLARLCGEGSRLQLAACVLMFRPPPGLERA